MMRWFWLIILLLTPSIARAIPTANDVSAYIHLAEMDQRLATIGYRLAAANAPFCALKQRNPGWVLHSDRQYPDRDTARAAFVFPTPLALSAVVPGGPADKAGLKQGFGLADMEGGLWFGGELKQHKASVELVDTVNGRVEETLAARESITLAFTTQSGETQSYTITPPLVCASTFWVDTRGTKDAGADGKGVRITSGMMDYVSDDAELAAIIAHEMTHNLLGHRQRLNATRKAKTKAIYATEIEADRLSVWLMANAGYDPKAALTFAERFGRKYGLGVFSDGTHPRWKKRVAIMQAEIDLIAATQPADGLRAPPLLRPNSPQ